MIIAHPAHKTERKHLMFESTATPQASEVTPPLDIKAKQSEAADKFAKENKMPFTPTDVEPVKGTDTDPETTPAYKLGDVDLEESEVKTILKVFKKDKFEDVASDWENNQNWKKRNAEEGQKVNVTKAEAERVRKEAESLKEELVNRQKRLKEDLLKETEINKSYDAQVKQIKDDIQAKKATFDLDDPDDAEKFEDFRFDAQTEISLLKLKRDNELSAHKSYMDNVETEEKEKQERMARENLFNLAKTYPDKFDENKIFSQHIQFQKLTPEQKKEASVLDNFPDYKEYIILRDFAIQNGVLNLSSAQELRYLRDMVKTYIGEQSDWEKKLAEIKKSGHDEAVKEIKAKGVSFFETTDSSKSITVEDLNADTTKIRNKQLALADEYQRTKFPNRLS